MHMAGKPWTEPPKKIRPKALLKLSLCVFLLPILSAFSLLNFLEHVLSLLISEVIRQRSNFVMLLPLARLILEENTGMRPPCEVVSCKLTKFNAARALISKFSLVNIAAAMAQCTEVLVLSASLLRLVRRTSNQIAK